MNKKQPVLTICSSVSFYRKAIVVSDELSNLGFKVVLPTTANDMKLGKITKPKTDWTNSKEDILFKTQLISEHFDKIQTSDAILVLNYEKNNQNNYIGANVLMEMTIAFYLHKPIFVLNSVPYDSPFISEILGLQPIFLKGYINNIKL